MKLLTPEEAGKISPVKNGRTTLISSALLNLQPGAGLIVDRTDWKGLSSPYRIARHITKRKALNMSTAECQMAQAGFLNGWHKHNLYCKVYKAINFILIKKPCSQLLYGFLFIVIC